ncbi:uncharacterized protein LOC132608102 [Lycium barbarum]|uniref:uncharacterized protein LOC132608102 n=1 Tax=Lycium barbarum TaxID=112863 RepID=UPI00293E617B|nr:uncharacterized protein LOC132608102 [Lycium barbarum]
MLRGEAVIDEEGVLRIKGRVCVPRVGDLIKTILIEVHSSRYSIHPGANKMYCNLRQHYWWTKMKRDIVEFLAQCLNCQQQSERTIQVLEDMLQACVIGFGGHWDQFSPLAEFAYNNSYHSSIGMDPFEELYERRYRSSIGWFDAFEVRP